ncbi:MAG: hypothetical protein M1363_04040, partial [Gammaproteobacteria bacterium]|nr:hypothetical protein [Gammaproteobacteria bacterium]
DQQDAVKEDKYLAQAQSTVTIFEQDLATVRTLLEQSSKNYRVMRTHSWRQQTTDALAKLSSNISAVYSLNPPSRYQGAHAHLMNAAYYIQQFSYLLASAMPACSTCSVDTGMYDEAHNQYLLFVREWGLFKNDIQNAQNAQ